MGKFGDSLISGLGSGIVGAGLGLIGSIGAGRRQEEAIEAQKEAQMALNEQAAKLNYLYGERAAENAYNRHTCHNF